MQIIQLFIFCYAQYLQNEKEEDIIEWFLKIILKKYRYSQTLYKSSSSPKIKNYMELIYEISKCEVQKRNQIELLRGFIFDYRDEGNFIK